MANISCIPGLSLRCLNSKIESGFNYCDGKMTEAFSKTQEFVRGLPGLSEKFKKKDSNKEKSLSSLNQKSEEITAVEVEINRPNGPFGTCKRRIIGLKKLKKRPKKEAKNLCQSIMNAMKDSVGNSQAQQDLLKRMETEIYKTIKNHQSVLDLNASKIGAKKHWPSFPSSPSGSLATLEALNAAGIKEVRLFDSKTIIAHELKVEELERKLKAEQEKTNQQASQISELETNLTNQGTQLRLAERQSEEQKMQLQKKEEELRKLKIQLNQVQQEFTALAMSLQNTQLDSGERKEKLEAQQTELEKLRMELKEANQTFDKRETELQTKETELQKKEQALKEREARLKEQEEAYQLKKKQQESSIFSQMTSFLGYPSA